EPGPQRREFGEIIVGSPESADARSHIERKVNRAFAYVREFFCRSPSLLFKSLSAIASTYSLRGQREECGGLRWGDESFGGARSRSAPQRWRFCSAGVILHRNPFQHSPRASTGRPSR